MKNKSPDQKIVIIDNYDSFTYNLVHLVEKIIDDNVIVYLNDEFELSEIELFDKIIISPGPGLPENAGKTLEEAPHCRLRRGGGREADGGVLKSEEPFRQPAAATSPRKSAGRSYIIEHSCTAPDHRLSGRD